MKYCYTFLLTLLLHCVYAQSDAIYMAVLPFQSNDASELTYAESIRTYVTDLIDEDYRFVLVERDDLNAVAQEREYQKSEDFIDGKVVEQGKAIGAEYLLEGFFNRKTNVWTFSVFDVSNASLRCALVADKARKKDESGLVKVLSKMVELSNKLDPLSMPQISHASKPSNYVIKTNIAQLIKECFPNKYWAVVRATEETGSKVKELLIAAGSKMQLKKGHIVEILAEIIEEVDGVKMERTISIGWGRITRIESENFSYLKIEAGAKNIKKQIKEGHKLRCRFVKK